MERETSLSDQLQVLDLLEGRARCYSRLLQDFQGLSPGLLVLRPLKGLL